MIFKNDFLYKKAGVIVMEISTTDGIQTNFIDYDAERFKKMKKLDAVIDKINKIGGADAIVLGSQQYTAKKGKGKAGVFSDTIKHDFRSKNPTTRWSDIIILK